MISATARDTTSPPLPAEVCTTSSIGLLGYGCAIAGNAAHTTSVPTIIVLIEMAMLTLRSCVGSMESV